MLIGERTVRNLGAVLRTFRAGDDELVRHLVARFAYLALQLDRYAEPQTVRLILARFVPKKPRIPGIFFSDCGGRSYWVANAMHRGVQRVDLGSLVPDRVTILIAGGRSIRSSILYAPTPEDAVTHAVRLTLLN